MLPTMNSCVCLRNLISLTYSCICGDRMKTLGKGFITHPNEEAITIWWSLVICFKRMQLHWMHISFTCRTTRLQHFTDLSRPEISKAMILPCGLKLMCSLPNTCDNPIDLSSDDSSVSSSTPVDDAPIIETDPFNNTSTVDGELNKNTGNLDINLFILNILNILIFILVKQQQHSTLSMMQHHRGITQHYSQKNWYQSRTERTLDPLYDVTPPNDNHIRHDLRVITNIPTGNTEPVSRFGHDLSNLVKSVNNVLKLDRELDVVGLFSSIWDRVI